MKTLSICRVLPLFKNKWGLVTSNKLLTNVYISGCFMRYLENSNTVCIFCDSAAVDLENITVCTYSKHRELSSNSLLYTYNGKSYIVGFFPSSLFFTVDYTVEKKNHTTVTTVIPKIGKIPYLFLLQFSSFAAVAMFLTTVFLCLSRRARCGCLSSSGNTVDQLVPDSLRGLFFLPQTLQPPPEHLLPPQQR